MNNTRTFFLDLFKNQDNIINYRYVLKPEYSIDFYQTDFKKAVPILEVYFENSSHENYQLTTKSKDWSLGNLLNNNLIKYLFIIYNSQKKICGVSCVRPYLPQQNENHESGYILLARTHTTNMIEPIVNSLILRSQLIITPKPNYITLNPQNYRVFNNFYTKILKAATPRSELYSLAKQNLQQFSSQGVSIFNHTEQLVLKCTEAKLQDLEIRTGDYCVRN